MSQSQTHTGKIVTLREVASSDIDTLFPFQIDPQANHMAAFTSKEPHTPESFRAWWGRLLPNPAIIKRLVLCEGTIVGSIMKFDRDGVPEVTYWFGRQYWGQGLATAGLSLFLAEVAARPLHARVAKDNIASFRVLQKCGFRVTAEEQGFAEARGKEIPEFVLTLDR